MITFRRPDTDLPLRVSIDPELVYQMEETILSYREDKGKQTPVVKVYFRNGGVTFVRDEDRTAMDRINKAKQWGEYDGPDSETG